MMLQTIWPKTNGLFHCDLLWLNLKKCLCIASYVQFFHSLAPTELVLFALNVFWPFNQYSTLLKVSHLGVFSSQPTFSSHPERLNPHWFNRVTEEVLEVSGTRRCLYTFFFSSQCFWTSNSRTVILFHVVLTGDAWSGNFLYDGF